MLNEIKFDSKRIRVLLDMDDVLIDWSGECVKLIGLNKEHPTIINALEETWGIGNLLDDNRMWDVIHSLGETWWASLPLLPWGKELWYGLNERYPVTILTSPSRDPSCLSGKHKWILNNLGDTRNFLIGRNKHWCANPYSVLVDDRQRNCDEFVEAGGHAYRWPNATKMQRLIKENKLKYEDVLNDCYDFINNISNKIDNKEIISGTYKTYDI